MHHNSISVDSSSLDGSFDIKINIMLLGDSNVGKSSILRRYCENQFSPNFISSIGVDFETKILKINNQNINVSIWDTAGQERYKVLSKNYYNQSDGFIIVYDITKNGTFFNIKKWIEEINDSSSEYNKAIIVGNKSDLEEDREIKKEDGKKLAKDHNLNFFEISALNGHNIDKAFDCLIKIILKDIKSKESNGSNSSSKLTIERHRKNNKRKCC